MSNFSAILGSLGYNTDAANTSGSAHAKLTQLLARITSTSLYEGTQAIPVIYPNLAVPVQITSGSTAGTFGSYGQIVAASVLTAHSLVALHFEGFSSPIGTWAVEIGEGGAGAEVVKWRAGFSLGRDINYDESTMPDWFFPGYQVTANARMAARCTHSTNNALSMNVWGIFVPRPY